VEMADFEFITYRQYVGVSTILILFVALTAPDVVCPDRAQRVLPLLFSRPLTGVDYVVAKLGAIAFIVFGFSFLPQVVLFLGQMLVSKDGALTYFTDNAEVLWQVPISVALLAIYYAAIGVALASLTDRRIVGGVAILGTAFVTTAGGGILVGPSQGDGSPLAWISIFFVPLDLRDLVFLGHLHPVDSGLSGVDGGGLIAIVAYSVYVIAAFSLLLYRYREVDL